MFLLMLACATPDDDPRVHDHRLPSAAHRQVDAGLPVVATPVTDPVTGALPPADLPVDVEPTCPTPDPVIGWGTVADNTLNELSGLAASQIDPDAYWVHEDSGNVAALVAIDATGATLASHPLTGAFTDLEDLAVAIDPDTGLSTVFVADTGDNGRSRGEVAVWFGDEPDPHSDGTITLGRLGLVYPDGPHDVETLLVDPITLDLFLVTKTTSGTPQVYAKRGPHTAGGAPAVLEALGGWSSLPLSATGGDVSPDGTQIVVRNYGTTAWMWLRDESLPLEDAFAGAPCALAIHGEAQGESIGFTADGAGIVTVSERVGPVLYYVGW